MEHTMNRHREEQRQNHIEMHNPTKATDANNHPFGDMRYVRRGATNNGIRERKGSDRQP